MERLQRTALLCLAVLLLVDFVWTCLEATTVAALATSAEIRGASIITTLRTSASAQNPAVVGELEAAVRTVLFSNRVCVASTLASLFLLAAAAHLAAKGDVRAVPATLLYFLVSLEGVFVTGALACQGIERARTVVSSLPTTVRDLITETVTHLSVVHARAESVSEPEAAASFVLFLAEVALTLIALWSLRAQRRTTRLKPRFI